MKVTLSKIYHSVNWRIKNRKADLFKKYEVLAKRIFFKKSLQRINKNIKNWNNSISNPTLFYLDMHRYFFKGLPTDIVNHKNYFRENFRGFGENAFHSMWTIVLRKYQIHNFLEIGIYRGQVMSLLALLSKLNDTKINIAGIAPFDNSGDENSKYIDIDYIKDILMNFDYFDLPHPTLLKAYSTDDKAKRLIESCLWDCVYIDGSHDYEIVKYDWDLCSQNIKKGGIIVFDDASLYTNFKNPPYAFKGHPGPSLVADQIMDLDFKEVLRVGHNRVFEKIN